MHYSVRYFSSEVAHFKILPNSNLNETTYTVTLKDKQVDRLREGLRMIPKGDLQLFNFDEEGQVLVTLYVKEKESPIGIRICGEDAERLKNFFKEVASELFKNGHGMCLGNELIH